LTAVIGVHTFHSRGIGKRRKGRVMAKFKGKEKQPKIVGRKSRMTLLCQKTECGLL